MAAVNKVLESEDKVDITPMIDIVFLLLVYFMFLPLQQEADVGIKLPSATPPAENLKLPSEHVIEIFPNGLILLNGAPMDAWSMARLQGLVVCGSNRVSRSDVDLLLYRTLGWYYPDFG